MIAQHDTHGTPGGSMGKIIFGELHKKTSFLWANFAQYSKNDLQRIIFGKPIFF